MKPGLSMHSLKQLQLEGLAGAAHAVRCLHHDVAALGNLDDRSGLPKRFDPDAVAALHQYQRGLTVRDASARSGGFVRKTRLRDPQGERDVERVDESGDWFGTD